MRPEVVRQGLSDRIGILSVKGAAVFAQEGETQFRKLLYIFCRRFFDTHPLSPQS